MPDIVIVDTLDVVVDRKSFPNGRPFAVNVMEGWPEGWPDNTMFVIPPNRKVYDAMQAGPMIMAGDEEWTVALAPHGPVAGAAVLGFLTQTIASTGIAVWQLLLTAVSLAGSFLLAPKLPNLSGGSYEWEQDTTGQFFSAQTNRLRPGSRVPDVFGVVRVWPDLIVEPWIEYNGTRQTLKELYVVSNGECSVVDPRVSSEQADAAVGASITVYQPGSGWPLQDDMPIYQSNTFVGQVGLPGPNNTDSSLANFDMAADVISSNVPGYFNAFKGFVGAYFRLIGDNVDDANKQVLYKATTVSPDGSFMQVVPNIPVQQFGIGGVQFRGANEVAVDGAGNAILYGPYNWGQYWYYLGGRDDYWKTSGSGSYNALSDGKIGPSFGSGTMWNPTSGANIGASWLNLGTSVYHQSANGTRITGFQFRGSDPGGGFYFVNWNSDGDYNPQVPSSGTATSVFAIPGNANRIEFDLEFPGGLYQQTAGQPPIAREVVVRMYYRTVGTTTWDVFEDFTFADLTRTPRRFTRGVDVAAGEYEVYFARQTEEIDQTGTFAAVDAVQLIGLRGRQEFTDELKNDNLNCTLVLLELQSQDVGQVVRQRDFSVVAQRILPDNSYDGDTTRAPSDSMEQCILYTLVDQGKYDVNNITRDRLAAIQTDLNAVGTGGMGNFNGIFDQTMTMEDQMSLIANLGRISAFRRGSTIDFSRNKQNELPTRLINSRNKVEPETRVMNFGDTNEATSVILRFMDATQDFKESSVQYPTGPGTEINPEEQSVLGLTDPVQAQRMAQYLWDKRTFQRDSISIPASDDGILASPGDVIAVTDHLNEQPPFDGEITDVVDTVWFFDDTVDAGTYILRVTDTVGDIYFEGQVSPGAETDRLDLGVTAPTAPISSSTVSYRYSFTTLTQDPFDLYIVESIEPVREGPVTLNCTAYRDEIYQSDNAAISLDDVSQAAKKVGN